MLRMLLVVAGLGNVFYAVAGLLWLTPLDVGVGVAAAAACWLVYGLVWYVETKSREEMRRQRDAVWHRRIAEQRRVIRECAR
jgi:hypothetical protein